MIDKQQHEPRILIHFDIKNNKIHSAAIPLKEEDFLENRSNHYYTVHYHKTLIHITKYIRGSIVISYTDKFSCSAPRNKGDTIWVDCNGIKANIYAWEKW